MNIQENVQIVKDVFAAVSAVSAGEKQRLLALTAEDIEWIIPGEGWPLAGTHRGHAGLADLLERSRTILSSPLPFEMAS
jgi:ketosteroid isomerase-like protein